MSQYVYGKNSVKILLEKDPRRVHKIWLGEGLKPDKRINEIYTLAKQHGLLIQKVPREKLDKMAKENQPPATPGQDHEKINHQGIIASVSPKARLTLEELIQKCQPAIEAGQYPLILALDNITDARNFGAIIRTADAAGVTGIIIPKHGSTGFGAAVSKTASGAEESVDIVQVTNLVTTLKTLKEKKFWIYGTTLSGDSVEYTMARYDMPIVLVMGSEGEGLGRLVEETCDVRIHLPMLGVVDSLNVSVATGVFLYEILRQQGQAS